MTGLSLDTQIKLAAAAMERARPLSAMGTNRRPKARTVAWQVVLLAFGMGGFVCFMLVMAVMMGAFASAGPVLRAKITDATTKEAIAITAQWESWPSDTDPGKRCNDLATAMRKALGQMFTVESAGCAP